MKKVSFLKMIAGMVLVMMLSVQGVNAQNAGGNGKGEKLRKELNLTDDQAAKLKSLRQDAKSRMQDFKSKEGSMTKAEIRAARKSMRQDERGKLEQILNKDQLAKFDQIKQERRASKMNGKH